ncbi:MAG: flavin reductase family protein [Deltaproteobacteria bacterium]|nr:flavin reductase family protein [Deltaproteobacteria bacterium]
MTDKELRTLTWDEAVTLTSPHPYVLASCADAAGRPNAIGLGWWTICSWEPPMVVISLGEPRYSRECIDAGQEFVLCFLGEEHAKGAWICGTKSGRKGDKLAGAGLTTIPSLKVKAPTVAQSVVALECAVRQRVPAGDHILYVGEVLSMRGIPGGAKTLFSLHYRKLIAIGPDGNASLSVPFK